jgi:hypothetical protein
VHRPPNRTGGRAIWVTISQKALPFVTLCPVFRDRGTTPPVRIHRYRAPQIPGRRSPVFGMFDNHRPAAVDDAAGDAGHHGQDAADENQSP